MTLEEAITTAIDYEKKIRDIYFEGVRNVDDAYGQRFFRALGEDEQRHVDYLQHKLDQWRTTGKLVPERLESTFPSSKVIHREVSKIKHQMDREDRGIRQRDLSKALKMEVQTSDFFKKMVNELPTEEGKMFAQFLEIEDAHIKAVRFELDYISETGYWFDFKEFDME